MLFRGWQRQARQHARPAFRPRSDGQAPAKLLRPLSHRGESYSCDTVAWYPYAVVCDLHLHNTRPPVDLQTNVATLSVGVARDVGYGFLDLSLIHI